MKHKLTFGHVTINLVTCPNKKADFEKKFTGRVPDVGKAWDEISKWKKKNKSLINKEGEV